MIVNYKEDGWEIITQRAHGVLAAQLGAQWKIKETPSRWLETLLAIAEHDDAENELDGENLLTAAGGPLNFAMKQFDLQHCLKLSSLSVTKSRYIALLTSMHMVFLYSKDEETDPEAKTFLNGQRRIQDVWRKQLGITKKEARRMYSLLEWCDALSLLLCKNDTQPENRRVEISTGPDEKAYYLLQAGENKLTVEPWPFHSAGFEATVETRLIRQIRFQSSEEFREAFLAASVDEKRWKLEKVKPKASSKIKKKQE